MARPTFVGFDLETTAGHQLGRICQIGAAFNAMRHWSTDVCPGNLEDAVVCQRWPHNDILAQGEFLVETDALKVNGFDDARMAAGTPTEAADGALDAFLAAHCGPAKIKRGDLIPVGFNVAGFDMPFVRRELPLSASWFSYRTLDLNALCFALGESSQAFDDRAMGWEGYKKRAKRYATQILGEPHWHDAGFDAVAALVMFRYLSGEMGSA